MMSVVSLRPKRALISVAAGVAMLVALAPGASARPARSVETEYYSTASMTTQVGTRHLTCSGSTVRAGTTSPYKTTVYEDC